MRRFSSYKVQKGDTLWSISREAYGTGTHWAEIQAANGNVLKRGTLLYVGQRLHIPPEGAYVKMIPRGMAHGPTPHVDPSAPAFYTPPPPAHTGAEVPGHAPAFSLHEKTQSGPFKEARDVEYPWFKYELSGMKIVGVTANATYEAQFTGELNMRRKGTIDSNITFTKKSVELEFKKPVDVGFNEMFTKSTPKFDGKKLTMELGFGETAKFEGQELYTTEVVVLPVVPPVLKWTYKTREVKGTYKELEFKGQIGYELTVTMKKDDPINQHQLVPSSEVVRWAEVGAVGLIITAGVIVVVDAGKDILFPPGAAETPLSWAAAAELFGSGMAILRGGAAVAH